MLWREKRSKSSFRLYKYASKILCIKSCMILYTSQKVDFGDISRQRKKLRLFWKREYSSFQFIDQCFQTTSRVVCWRRHSLKNPHVNSRFQKNIFRWEFLVDMRQTNLEEYPTFFVKVYFGCENNSEFGWDANIKDIATYFRLFSVVKLIFVKM